MKFDVIATTNFKREIKKLLKKYPSLHNEYLSLVENLEHSPKQGTSIGRNCFKIRLSIKSKGKGKSGGARVITCFVLVEKSVYLLSIYDKSMKENITDKQLGDFLDGISDG